MPSNSYILLNNQFSLSLFFYIIRCIREIFVPLQPEWLIVAVPKGFDYNKTTI